MQIFSSIPELFSGLARVSINREILRNCCSVYKLFNASFTPFLYPEIWFRTCNAQYLTEDLPTFLNNEALKYTKILDLAIPGFPQNNTYHDEGTLSELYNLGVQALLAEIPQLKCFR
jgi:hypothetical protein